MFDIIDTAFSHDHDEALIVCSFLQDFSKDKGSSLQHVQCICNAHTAFLLCGAKLFRGVLVRGWQVCERNRAAIPKSFLSSRSALITIYFRHFHV